MSGTSGGRGIPRWLDAAAALAVLTLCLPLLAIAAFLIKLDSHGPVLFRQVRVGKNGRLFTLFKLRTMGDNPQDIQVTSRDDPRVTRAGRRLRAAKVDELPELFNVVKGDMALVGPRPEVPRYADPRDPRWMRVLEVRPGITDLVTLRLRNEEELLRRAGPERERFYRESLLPFKLRGYIAYNERRSLWTDMNMLIKSILAVIRPAAALLPRFEEIETESTGRNA